MASLKFGVIRKWVNEKGWRKHIITVLSVLLIVFESKTLNNLLKNYTDMQRELENLEETISKSGLAAYESAAKIALKDCSSLSRDKEGNLVSEIDLKTKLSKTELELIKLSNKESPVSLLLYLADKTSKTDACSLETEVVSTSR